MEDVLKNGIRNEAKLIGYNEDPIDVVDLVGLDVENLNILETFGGNSERSSSYVIRRGLPQAPSKTEDRIYSIVNGFMSGKSTWISNEYDGQYGEKERVITNFFSIQKCRCPQRYYKMKVHFDKTTNYDPSYL